MLLKSEVWEPAESASLGSLIIHSYVYSIFTVSRSAFLSDLQVFQMHIKFKESLSDTQLNTEQHAGWYTGTLNLCKSKIHVYLSWPSYPHFHQIQPGIDHIVPQYSLLLKTCVWACRIHVCYTVRICITLSPVISFLAVFYSSHSGSTQRSRVVFSLHISLVSFNLRWQLKPICLLPLTKVLEKSRPDILGNIYLLVYVWYQFQFKGNAGTWKTR